MCEAVGNVMFVSPSKVYRVNTVSHMYLYEVHLSI